MLELPEKDIKAVNVLVFLMFKTLGRDMEDMKKTHIKHLEMKNTMSAMRHIWEWIKSW